MFSDGYYLAVKLAVNVRSMHMGRGPQIQGTIGNSRATYPIRLHIQNKHSYTANNIHTVNERIVSIGWEVLMSSADLRVDHFVEMIRFFSTLILNADESRYTMDITAQPE